jgi:hypothetical protein
MNPPISGQNIAQTYRACRRGVGPGWGAPDPRTARVKRAARPAPAPWGRPTPPATCAPAGTRTASDSGVEDPRDGWACRSNTGRPRTERKGDSRGRSSSRSLPWLVACARFPCSCSTPFLISGSTRPTNASKLVHPLPARPNPGKRTNFARPPNPCKQRALLGQHPLVRCIFRSFRLLRDRDRPGRRRDEAAAEAIGARRSREGERKIELPEQDLEHPAGALRPAHGESPEEWAAH